MKCNSNCVCTKTQNINCHLSDDNIYYIKQGTETEHHLLLKSLKDILICEHCNATSKYALVRPLAGKEERGVQQPS